MLERARAAMTSGNPALALSLLDTYTDRFPHPAMLPEATVLRIEALTKAGDPAAARRAADAFLATYPASPYADRIRTLLGASNR
jgi:outer membrane protein assembly factor BamD (BamD/ComL family)